MPPLNLIFKHNKPLFSSHFTQEGRPGRTYTMLILYTISPYMSIWYVLFFVEILQLSYFEFLQNNDTFCQIATQFIIYFSPYSSVFPQFSCFFQFFHAIIKARFLLFSAFFSFSYQASVFVQFYYRKFSMLLKPDKFKICSYFNFRIEPEKRHHLPLFLS